MDGCIREVVQLKPFSEILPQTPDEQIVRHLVYRHCSVFPHNVMFSLSQLDFLLTTHDNVNPHSIKSFVDLENSFTDLINKISGQKGDGFLIKGISPADSVFSRTSIAVPVGLDTKNRYYTKIKVIIKVSVKTNPFAEDLNGFKKHELFLMAKIVIFLKKLNIQAYLTSSSIEIFYKNFCFT
ncbi:hypothetical protein MXB_377, partial [Myxobolus squamalis]